VSVEIGSEWFYLGHHWLVESEGERDGEPAVRCKIITKGRSGRVHHVHPVRYLERKGTRTKMTRALELNEER
jgi:hypothetical protein